MSEVAVAHRERPAPTSHPIISRKLTLHTHQAQRVDRRLTDRLNRTLYNLDVILRIIGSSKEVDAVTSKITDKLRETTSELKSEKERVEKIRSDNLVEVVHAYSHPVERNIDLSTPYIFQVVDLLEMFDSLVRSIDALWFAGQFKGSQKEQATWTWQRRLVKLGNEIIDLERRARNAADKKEKTDEVREAVGDADPTAIDLDTAEPVAADPATEPSVTSTT